MTVGAAPMTFTIESEYPKTPAFGYDAPSPWAPPENFPILSLPQ